MEEFRFVRRAICFESNEDTVATPSRVDLVEIVDSDDDSNITGDDEGEITSTDESEIEDEKEDSQQVSPSACQLKAELSSFTAVLPFCKQYTI